jgi:hypothetical protein
MWFVLAQIPALLGMSCVGSVTIGWIPADPFGGAAFFALLATLGGCLLSIFLSLLFDAAYEVKVGKQAAIFYAVYLAAWVLFLVYVATRPPPYHGPGGF